MNNKNGFNPIKFLHYKKESKMPPQKNSGNRGAKKHRESGASSKSKREVDEMLCNIDNISEGKYVSRVTRKLGNGRVEMVYLKKEKDSVRTDTGQAIIRGSFRGRGKRDVWIDIGTYTIVEENLGVLEIVGVLTREQMKQIITLNDDYKKILGGDEERENEATIEFGDDSDEEEKPDVQEEVVSKKDKVKHKRENVPIERKEDLSDIDIDDI